MKTYKLVQFMYKKKRERKEIHFKSLWRTLKVVIMIQVKGVCFIVFIYLFIYSRLFQSQSWSKEDSLWHVAKL